MGPTGAAGSGSTTDAGRAILAPLASISGNEPIVKVGMPACSTARAISPTDWQEIGQTATSNAASTVAAYRRCATSGP
jgi:hypothetical protein